MYQKKNTQFALRRLMLAVSLLLICVILVVGVTWARYQTEKNSYLEYKTRNPGAVSLCTAYNEDGTLTEGNVTWTWSEGVGTAHFYISNGTSTTEYSNEDVSATIRLLGSLSATNATVEMTVSDGSSTTTWLSATPVQIKEGTPLYSTFGNGNTYVFLNEDGSELSWNLEGGTLSVLSVDIYVDLGQIQDAALLQLQVVGN